MQKRWLLVLLACGALGPATGRAEGRTDPRLGEAARLGEQAKKLSGQGQKDKALQLLEVGPEAIWERGIQPRRDTPFITRYACKFGASPEAIHAYFIGEQERIRADFSRSRMVKHHLRVDGPLAGYLDQARAFWLE